MAVYAIDRQLLYGRIFREGLEGLTHNSPSKLKYPYTMIKNFMI